MKKVLALLVSFLLVSPIFATDVYVASTGSDGAGTGTSGNPFATPGKGCGALSGGGTLYIKNAVYTATSAVANVSGGYCDPPSGTAAAPTRVIGYNSTITDLNDVTNFANFPTIKSAAAGATTVFRGTNSYIHVSNLIVDGAGIASTYGMYVNGSNSQYVNIKVSSAPLHGFYVGGNYNTFSRCLSAGNGVGFNFLGIEACQYSVATANTVTGFWSQGTIIFWDHNIAYANTGATVDGFLTSSSNISMSSNLISDHNGRDGFRISGANVISAVSVHNSIFSSNGAYGIDSVTDDISAANININNNAFWNNTSGAVTRVPVGSLDVTLSADPFVASGSGNFSLNSTAGAGAACKAFGFPGAMPGGLTTGYLDIGAAQHQDSGGAAATTVLTFVQ